MSYESKYQRRGAGTELPALPAKTAPWPLMVLVLAALLIGAGMYLRKQANSSGGQHADVPAPYQPRISGQIAFIVCDTSLSFGPARRKQYLSWINEAVDRFYRHQWVNLYAVDHTSTLLFSGKVERSEDLYKSVNGDLADDPPPVHQGASRSQSAEDLILNRRPTIVNTRLDLVLNDILNILKTDVSPEAHVDLLICSDGDNERPDDTRKRIHELMSLPQASHLSVWVMACPPEGRQRESLQNQFRSLKEDNRLVVSGTLDHPQEESRFEILRSR